MNTIQILFVTGLAAIALGTIAIFANELYVNELSKFYLKGYYDGYTCKGNADNTIMQDKICRDYIVAGENKRFNDLNLTGEGV